MIEVMVALLLTAIAIIGLIALYMSQSRASSYSRRTTEATMLATDELERLRTVALPASTTVTGLDVQGEAGGMFSRTSTVTAVGTDYYDLTVRVTWQEDGVNQQLTLNGRRNQ